MAYKLLANILKVVVINVVLESKIESYFKDQLKLCGGITYKFTSPSRSGVPDQIALFQGETYFVELKAPGEEPRALQIEVHKEFEEHGVPVYIIDTLTGVDDFVKDVLKTTPITKEDIQPSRQLKINHFDI